MIGQTIQHDLSSPDWPARQLLDQISDQWTLLVLGTLCASPLRFNEISRRIDGLTQTALTDCLRRLDRNGLIVRTVIARSPIAVKYAISPLGRTLSEPFAALFAWALLHVDAVQDSQQRFDACLPTKHVTTSSND